MPGLGSEPGMGWGVVRQAALRHEVCVVADRHNRPYVQAELAARPLPGVSFVFAGSRRLYARTAGSRLPAYLYYFLWQLHAYRAARRLHRERPFDLVHHVTYNNSWAPSFMGRLGIPFIWCAGGREVAPHKFYRMLSWKSRVAELARTAAVRALGALVRRFTGSRASVVLSSSDPALWGGRLPVRRFLTGGLDQAEVERLRRLPERAGGPFRIASIGRLEGWKGFSLGVRAFAELQKHCPESEYLIIGEGPERRFLEKQAVRLGCAEKIRFLGRMPRSALLALYGQFDVLVHPSLHEQFGYVVLEAMAAGRPVVCLACGGCGELVSAGGGIAVPVSTPEAVATDLSTALRELAEDPEFRRRVGRRARERASQHWNWDRAGERLEAVYREALQCSSGRAAEARLEPAG